jgi:ribonuclease HII
LPSFPGRHFVGVDENGVGPRLGPMIVTSVLAEAADDAAAKLLTSKPRGAVAKRIGDSKKLVAFDDSALGEAWARAIVRRSGGTASTPTTPAGLLEAIGIDTESALREPCPSHHVDLCWGTAGEAFTSTEDDVAACEKDLDRLAAKGVRVMRARLAILCTRRLNDAVDRGLSRFDLDLHTMERLTLAAKNEAGAEVYALCGKVGGFDFYADRFGPLAGWLHTTLIEGRARSEYLVPGVGRLAFVRDADESHLIVGLASLVGKWARDHLMRRVVRWHRERSPGEIEDVSGYHDPATTRFIQATSLVRKKHRLDGACFEREALGPTSSKRPKPKAPEQPKLPAEA